MNNIGHDAQEMLEALSEKQKQYSKKMSIKVAGGETFAELCSLVTRDDMNDIAEQWGTGKQTKLKKNEFAEAIKEGLCENLQEKLMGLDIETAGTLNKIIANKGIVSGDACNELDNKAVFYLRKLGLIFLGRNDKDENIIVIPSDLIEKISSIATDEKSIEAAHKNTTIIRTARGILYYYGIIEIEALTNVINGIVKDGVSVDALRSIIHEQEEAGDDLRIITDLEGFEKFEFVAHSKLSKPVEMLYAQNANGLEYKGFSVEEVIEAGVPNYSEWDVAHKKLYDYLMANYDISEVEGQMLVNAVIFGLKDGSTIEQSLDVLVACFMCDKTEKRDLEKLLIKVQEETRLWALRGNMPKEFKTQTVVKEDRVGRNEPCPCGSGKKFKKCCGKN